MTTMMSEIEDVKEELHKVDTRAYALYQMCKESRLRGFADDVNLLRSSLDEVRRQTSTSAFLRSKDAEPNRAKLLWLLHGCENTLWKLEDHLSRLFGPRDLPPPPLQESREIQEELMSRSKVLLKWGLELINEPERKSPRALPPSSPPEAKKRSPPSSGGRSPAIPTIEKPGHHKRHATYGRERSGGVPLPKPINTNLKPPTAEKAGGTPNSAQAPPSPYQPTVEEIPDEGSPDEDKPLHVEEYHMTPPDSTFGSASDPSDVAQSSADAPAAKGKDAQRTSAQISSKRKEKIESLPKVVLPDFTRKTSYKKEEFLSPSHAERRPESLSPPVDPWQRQQEDFPLWDSTEDEFEEERKMGAQTPFNVESLSAMNTPKDTMPPPSPRPRRRTQSRSSYQQTDPRSAKQSPRYSPGHSPWVNTQSYADDGRIRGANGKEKYTPQPSPKEAQKEFISARRPRAATHSQGAPYPSDNFSAYGGNQTFHFMAGGAGFVAESGDIFDKFFAGGYGSGSGTIDDSAHWSTAVNTGKGKDKVPQSAWSEAVGDSGVWSTAGNNGKEKESTVSSRDERSSKSARGSKDDDAAVKEITTQIALEEFYKGTTRKMKVTDRGSKSYRILELPIRPGLKTGSKIKFSGIELDSGNVTGDIHFIVQEKPHPIFKRDGDDLHATVDVDLYESLCGWERYITSICGKNVRVRNPTGTPTGPSWKECYAGLGMPKNKKPSERGDLWVGVNVIYPAKLSDEKRRLLREILRG